VGVSQDTWASAQRSLTENIHFPSRLMLAVALLLLPQVLPSHRGLAVQLRDSGAIRDVTFTEVVRVSATAGLGKAARVHKSALHALCRMSTLHCLSVPR
jgi:hypothetical protein